MTAVARPAAADPPTVIVGSKPLITIAAMIAGLMAFLDISIVNVALNDIRANFGMSTVPWRILHT